MLQSLIDVHIRFSQYQYTIFAENEGIFSHVGVIPLD